MKDPITTPGKTYAVTSPNGCTVTTEDGLTLAEVEAGKQGYFVAVSGKVLLSDEAAVLTQLFKLAPYQKLRLLGVVGGNLPAWLKALKAELTAMLDGSKFELAWLADEKKLVVHTDRVDDDLLEMVRATAGAYLPAGVELVQYNHNMEISWRDVNKYAECVTVADLKAVNPDYQKDVTSDGEWVYPLNSLKGENSVFEFAETIKTMYLHVPNLTSFASFFCNRMYSLSKMEIYAPKATSMIQMTGDINNLNFVKAFLPNLKVMKNWCFISNNNLPVRIEADFPKLEAGIRAFDKGKLDGYSVIRICNSIPSYSSGSHPLTLGIHVDYQTDDEVLEAIANAEAKGWTLTVQWNGTATAQASVTYGLRKPPIYARVSEMERPDGTVEKYLDWGHYVTDPTGYEEFRSVEAAREYYGLPDESFNQ